MNHIRRALTYWYTFGYPEINRRRGVNYFRVNRHLYSFEHVASGQVDSGGHLERQVDVGF